MAGDKKSWFRVELEWALGSSLQARMDQKLGLCYIWLPAMVVLAYGTRGEDVIQFLQWFNIHLELYSNKATF